MTTPSLDQVIRRAKDLGRWPKGRPDQVLKVTVEMHSLWLDSGNTYIKKSSNCYQSVTS